MQRLQTPRGSRRSDAADARGVPLNEAVEMSRDEARALVDVVRGDLDALWRKMVTLYRGKAHTLLGYDSWGAFCAAEFDLSKTAAYRLVSAAEVVEILGESRYRDSLPLTESQAYELAPLRRDPAMLAKVWQEACSVAKTNERAVTVDLIRKTRYALEMAAAFTPHRSSRSAAGDSRFDVVGDAVELLMELPRPSRMTFPVDPGDVDRFDTAMAWLAGWFPEADRAWREYRDGLTTSR